MAAPRPGGLDSPTKFQKTLAIDDYYRDSDDSGLPLVPIQMLAKSDKDILRGRALLLLRVASGAVFVAFGAGKFVNHGSELASFKTYGLPAPAAFVILIGVIELVGGVLVIAGMLTRPAALILAGDMIGAIIVSGLAKGEVISLTLAPALLAAMLILLWTGPGRLALRPPARLSRPGVSDSHMALPERNMFAWFPTRRACDDSRDPDQVRGDQSGGV